MQQRKLRVLWVGMEKYSVPLNITLAKKFELLARGVEPYVLSCSDNGRIGVKKIDSTRLYLLPYIVNPLLTAPVFFLVLPYLVIARKIDVLVTPDPLFVGPACALLKGALKLLGAAPALLIEAHGDWIEGTLQYARLGILRHGQVPRFSCFVLSAISKFSISSADMLRAVSEATAARMRRFAPDTPISIFPTRIDADFFSEQCHVRCARDNGHFRILYAGILSRLKGLQFLLPAFKEVLSRFPDTRLTIAGDGEERGNLEKMAHRLDISHGVEFAGYLAPETLRKYMAGAHLLVLPSLSEGLPRVIIEAMAAGLPVVATDVGGVREVVVNGETGYVIPPGDMESLKNSLMSLVAEPGKAKVMGANGRKLIEERGDLYTMEGYARRYIELLQQTYQMAQRSK